MHLACKGSSSRILFARMKFNTNEVKTPITKLMWKLNPEYTAAEYTKRLKIPVEWLITKKGGNVDSLEKAVRLAIFLLPAWKVK